MNPADAKGRGAAPRPLVENKNPADDRSLCESTAPVVSLDAPTMCGACQMPLLAGRSPATGRTVLLDASPGGGAHQVGPDGVLTTTRDLSGHRVHHCGSAG